MVKLNFRGLMAPVFTPINSDRDQTINLSIIPQYAEFLKKNGVNGVLINGTTGEGVSQTVEEREKTAEAWIGACKSTGQTVMVQVGGASLADVKRLAAHAEKHGASSILCLADLFHQPRNADDLLRYLQQVGASAPSTPLLYYHIPGFTGIDVNMKDLLEKAEKNDIAVPTFSGIKFTCNDLSMGGSLLTINPEKYAIFLGSDTILAAALCLGFDSAIGTTLNILPQLNIDIVNSMNGSDLQKARESQQKLSAAVFAISKHGSWVGTMKAAMNALTPINVGPVRDPLVNLSTSQISQFTSDLKKLKLMLL